LPRLATLPKAAPRAQVLDRLNPLLEPGGELLLNEAGAPGGRQRVLRPHAGFRLVLAVDPRCAPSCVGAGLRAGAAACPPCSDVWRAGAWAS